jgi:hypothetical protein
MDSTNYQAHELDWGDASLGGFVWENDGRDLRLFLSHASLPINGLVCSWASDLRVDLHWRRFASREATTPMPRSGPLLSTEGQISRTPGSRWRVSVAFGSDDFCSRAHHLFCFQQ